MKIYVNCNQPFPGMGTKACPFSTIQQAADAAMPGDEVLVAPGIYREDVHPLRGGSEENRIIYCAEVPGQECDYRGRSAVTVGRMRLRHLENRYPQRRTGGG